MITNANLIKFSEYKEMVDKYKQKAIARYYAHPCCHRTRMTQEILLQNNKNLSLSLLYQSINDPDGPNEEANLRGQNMRILKTETTYPESGRKVVKTYDDD
jgi:hypothetical protein